MSDKPGDRSSGLLGGNVWVLIPLAALSIPIIAVLGQATNADWIGWIIAILATIGGVTLSARSLMTHRSRLRIEELEARERVLRAEHEQLSAAEQILARDTGLHDLRQVVQRQAETETETG